MDSANEKNKSMCEDLRELFKSWIFHLRALLCQLVRSSDMKNSTAIVPVGAKMKTRLGGECVDFKPSVAYIEVGEQKGRIVYTDGTSQPLVREQFRLSLPQKNGKPVAEQPILPKTFHLSQKDISRDIENRLLELSRGARVKDLEEKLNDSKNGSKVSSSLKSAPPLHLPSVVSWDTFSGLNTQLKDKSLLTSMTSETSSCETKDKWKDFRNPHCGTLGPIFTQSSTTQSEPITVSSRFFNFVSASSIKEVLRMPHSGIPAWTPQKPVPTAPQQGSTEHRKQPPPMLNSYYVRRRRIGDETSYTEIRTQGIQNFGVESVTEVRRSKVVRRRDDPLKRNGKTVKSKLSETWHSPIWKERIEESPMKPQQKCKKNARTSSVHSKEQRKIKPKLVLRRRKSILLPQIG